MAIEEMARKLGPEYDSLLPETTPFLAELFEGTFNVNILLILTFRIC